MAVTGSKLLVLTKLSLQALRLARIQGALCVGITNVVGSAIARETDCGVHVNAGCEIGVASTKAYTSQIVVLIMVAVSLSQHHVSNVARCCAMTAALEKLPDAVSQVVAQLHAFASQYWTSCYSIYVCVLCGLPVPCF